MIITLSAVGLFIVGLLLILHGEETASDHAWICELVGILLLAFGGIIATICIVSISVAHTYNEQNTLDAQIEREMIVAQLEVAEESDNKIAYITAKTKAVEWNKDVGWTEAYSKSLLTNWFLARNMQIVWNI